MKRRAFILTEILTGMVIQAGFVLVLFGAFYLLLSFSTSTQQILAAHDEGQIVISYIDSRIRGAGLGLWKCGSPAGIKQAFGASGSITDSTAIFSNQVKGDLPVAVLKNRSTNNNVTITDTTKDATDKDRNRDSKVYKGNVLTLLYAHQDTAADSTELGKLFVYSKDAPVTLSAGTGDSSRKGFHFIDRGNKLESHFYFNWTEGLLMPSQSNRNYTNIKSWAVMEATGVPVRVSSYTKTTSVYTFKMNAPYVAAEVHSMSELLNLECERMFAADSSNERSFMVQSLGHDGNNAKWNDALPHTKGILELYMELDVRKEIPVFTLKVLVSEGLRDDGQATPRPSNWPAEYWNYNSKYKFSDHKVHVSQATWALYNLEPLTY